LLAKKYRKGCPKARRDCGGLGVKYEMKGGKKVTTRERHDENRSCDNERKMDGSGDWNATSTKPFFHLSEVGFQHDPQNLVILHGYKI
jgi:hypothetical protein